MCLVSYVLCHVSCFMCTMSCVTCHQHQQTMLIPPLCTERSFSKNQNQKKAKKINLSLICFPNLKKRVLSFEILAICSLIRSLQSIGFRTPMAITGKQQKSKRETRDRHCDIADSVKIFMRPRRLNDSIV